jgi:hypothetical protein
VIKVAAKISNVKREDVGVKTLSIPLQSSQRRTAPPPASRKGRPAPVRPPPNTQVRIRTSILHPRRRRLASRPLLQSRGFIALDFGTYDVDGQRRVLIGRSAAPLQAPAAPAPAVDEVNVDAADCFLAAEEPACSTRDRSG